MDELTYSVGRGIACRICSQIFRVSARLPLCAWSRTRNWKKDKLQIGFSHSVNQSNTKSNDRKIYSPLISNSKLSVGSDIIIFSHETWYIRRIYQVRMSRMYGMYLTRFSESEKRYLLENLIVYRELLDSHLSQTRTAWFNIDRCMH